MFGSPLLWHHAKVLNLPLFALNTLFLMYSISIHPKIVIVKVKGGAKKRPAEAGRRKSSENGSL